MTQTKKLNEVMTALESLATERMKKRYLGQGAHEPVFGVATGAMKPLAKKNKNNQELAEQLYATGNYDAMYLAGMIADVSVMTENDFDRWMTGAYFYMISDFVVAVTLAETTFAQSVAQRWIQTGAEMSVSAGYSCYCWLLGNREDQEFDAEELLTLLNQVKKEIHQQGDLEKSAMLNFVSTVAISYEPLHQAALEIAEEIGSVSLSNKKQIDSANVIRTAVEKGRIGFKRRHVRC